MPARGLLPRPRWQLHLRVRLDWPKLRPMRKRLLWCKLHALQCLREWRMLPGSFWKLHLRDWVERFQLYAMREWLLWRELHVVLSVRPWDM